MTIMKTKVHDDVDAELEQQLQSKDPGDIMKVVHNIIVKKQQEEGITNANGSYNRMMNEDYKQAVLYALAALGSLRAVQLKFGIQHDQIQKARKLDPDFDEAVMDAIDEFHRHCAANIVANAEPHIQSILRTNWKRHTSGKKKGQLELDADGNAISTMKPQDVNAIISSMDKISGQMQGRRCERMTTEVNINANATTLDLRKLSKEKLLQMNEWLQAAQIEETPND